MENVRPNTLYGQGVSLLNASVKHVCMKSLLHNRCDVTCFLQIIPTFISDSYLRVGDEDLFGGRWVSPYIKQTIFVFKRLISRLTELLSRYNSFTVGTRLRSEIPRYRS